jgi:hypothetical protein
MRSWLLVIALAIVAVAAACRSATTTGTPCANALALRVVFLDRAVADMSLRVLVPTGNGGEVQTQSFPIAAGATEATVMPTVGNDVYGRTLGVQLLHGPVIVGVSTVLVNDLCAPITVDSWAVDQGVAPHD